MISQGGHVALIVPNFAAPPVRRTEIGVYVYQGAKQWRTIAPDVRRNFLHIGL